MPILEVQHLYKNFGSTKVLKDISFTLERGKALAIIGSSGSGKTTLLRCLNFLETPNEGKIIVNGETLLDAADHTAKSDAQIRKNRLHFGMVFQSFNLFPQYTALENVMLAPLLQAKERPDYKQKKREIHEQIEHHAIELLEMMSLEGRMSHYPHQLSGGQQQRVAIARALVNEPEVLLLDEPLGALDLKLRKEMQIELKRMQKKLGITFIFVTHDQEEALTMSDTIAVMNHGIIQQIGCPTDVYNEPKNRFVARFIGESNIFEATMRRDYLVNIHGIDYECVDAGFGTEQPVDVVIRPEDVDFVPIGKTPLHGVVTSVLFMGVHYEFTVDCDGRIFKVHSTDFVPVGETVGIEVLPDAIHIMNPERRQPTEAAAEEPQRNL